MPGSTDSPTVPEGTAVDLPAAPAWRGVNHLALVTPDMDATVRFYAGVLGMPVVATTMAGPASMGQPRPSSSSAKNEAPRMKAWR